MPFRSMAQERYMFARHPAIAKRWVSEGSPTKGLPQHSRAAKRRSRRSGRR